MGNRVAYRGSIFTFKPTATLANLPKKKTEINHQYLYLEDGVLVVENGMISEIADYKDYKEELKDIKQIDYRGKLITPGFIDTHLHATQSQIVAVYGKQLIDWLKYYVFPAETRFQDLGHARQDFNFFLDQLIKNGTTTACLYGPLYYESSDLLFSELDKRNLRCIAGNTMADSHSPDALKLSKEKNYENAKKLLEKWHGKNRLSFCITPRFALTCSEELLEMCGALKQEFPDAYIQTHLSENLSEIEQVKKLFPWATSYLEVYDRYGLVTDQSIFGHCIYLTENEIEKINEKKSIISWCPTSNNFLGSGFFNFEKASKKIDQITLATDWGAGNTLSMFKVLDDAYKVSILNNHSLPSMIRWYLATLGSAKALKIGDKIGHFSKNTEADFIVIDYQKTAILKYRSQQVDDIFELLFLIMSLADDRNIAATYINGSCAYSY